MVAGDNGPKYNPTVCHYGMLFLQSAGVTFQATQL